MRDVTLIALRLSYGLVTRSWLLMLLAMVLASGSLMASIATGQWHWFSRSGALVVSIGAILSTRPLLRTQLRDMIEAHAFRDEGLVPPTDVARVDRRACFCGFWIVAVGTLIWAYGDLLECLAEWSAACLGD